MEENEEKKVAVPMVYSSPEPSTSDTQSKIMSDTVSSIESSTKPKIELDKEKLLETCPQRWKKVRGRPKGFHPVPRPPLKFKLKGIKLSPGAKKAVGWGLVPKVPLQTKSGIYVVTKKENDFLECYLETMDVRGSAKEAGLGEDEVQELLSSHIIKHHLIARIEDRATKDKLTKDFIVSTMYKAVSSNTELPKSQRDLLKLLSQILGHLRSNQINIMTNVNNQAPAPKKELAAGEMSDIEIAELLAKRGIIDGEVVTPLDNNKIKNLETKPETNGIQKEDKPEGTPTPA